MSSSECQCFVLDNWSLISVVEKISKEISRLEDEESQAEAALAEAFARISCLRNMQKQLRKKGVKMLKKVLDDMEALEEEEWKEAEEESRRRGLGCVQAREVELAFQIQSACATEAVDFSGPPSIHPWRISSVTSPKAVLLILLLPMDLADKLPAVLQVFDGFLGVVFFGIPSPFGQVQRLSVSNFFLEYFFWLELFFIDLD